MPGPSLATQYRVIKEINESKLQGAVMFPTPEIYLKAELDYRKETVARLRGRAVRTPARRRLRLPRLGERHHGTPAPAL